MLLDQIKQLTHHMRLFGIHNAFERRSQEAQNNRLDYLEFLRLILEEELLSRKNAVAKRLVTQAKFRSYADLEDWDESFDRNLTRAKVTELAQGSFYHNKENLILLGSTGVGKTHLAIALGRRLCHEGIKTAFFSVNLLFEEIAAERAAGKYLAFIKRLNKRPLIILDDFGLRNYTHEEATVFMDLLEERYQQGSLIVTSQVDPKGWGKLFEDPVIAEAITDRLTHPSQKITLKGGSYREKLKNDSSESPRKGDRLSNEGKGKTPTNPKNSKALKEK